MRALRHIVFSSLISANIAFSKPLNFAEAIQSREIRSVLPTTLSSAELHEISADILERAIVSARVPYAEYLQEIDDLLLEKLNGQIDDATFRTQLKVKLRELGYEPDPSDRDKITDFGSEQRLKLVIETNSQIAQGYGQFIQGQNAGALHYFPAQELYRLQHRRVERGTAKSKTIGWYQRWTEVGGKLTQDGGRTRMIARKDDDIWLRLGTEFDDSLGNPYPPFAFNSGMWVKDVSRKDAIQFGVIEPDTKITPQTRGFNDDLRYSVDVRNAALRQALEEEGYQFQTIDGNEVLTLGENG